MSKFTPAALETASSMLRTDTAKGKLPRLVARWETTIKSPVAFAGDRAVAEAGLHLLKGR